MAHDGEQQQRWYVRHARSLQQHASSRSCAIDCGPSCACRLWSAPCSSSCPPRSRRVLVTCVSWFHCTADMVMGGSGSAAVSGSVVYAFPAVSCYTSAYYAWSWLMGACMLTWLLMILATGWWMVKQRQTAGSTAASSSRSSSTCSWACLAAHCSLSSLALRPNVATERVDVQLPAPLTRWTSFAWYWPVHTPAAASSGWDEPVCESGVDGVVMETRREYAFRSLYGALYDSFRAEASGWVVVVWVRRLLLIVLSVVLTTLPSAKYLSFLLLHLVIICLHSYFQPFTTTSLNDTERVSILVHIVIAAVLTGYPSPTDAAVQSAVLTLTIAPLAMYLLYRQAQTYTLLKTDEWPTAKVPTVRVRVGVRVRDETLNAPLMESAEVEM